MDKKEARGIECLVFFFQDNMKKQRVFFMITSFALLMTFFSGCGNPENNAVNNSEDNVITPETQEAVESPFTMDYETEESTLDTFIKNDSFDSIVNGGPYAFTLRESIQPVLAEYEEMRFEKIGEAVMLTEEIYENATDIKFTLDFAKAYFVEMMDTAIAEDPELYKAGEEFAEMILGFQMHEEALVAAFESIETSGDDIYLAAKFEFHRTNLAVELQQVIIDDLDHFTALAAQMYLVLAESGNEVMENAAERFDIQMETIDELHDIVAEMQDNVIELDLILKQLNTAEYYMGLASLDYIQQELPALQEQIAAAEPTGRLSEEDIEFLEEYAEVFQSFAADSMDMMKDIDSKYLVEIDETETAFQSESYWFPSASAEGKNFSEKAFLAFSSGESLKRKIKRAPGVIWKNMKDGYKTTKKAFGAAAEGANLIAKEGFDEFFGWYYKNDAKATQEILDENRRAIAKRWKEDELGAPIFKQAENYFDDAEETGKDLAAGGVKMVFGEGNLSWLAGHMGKITVNMFTGFGKGTMKMLNPNSTDGEFAEGFLDVSLSFVGGSKVIFKGSQVVKGGAKSLKVFGKKGLNMLGRFLEGNHAQNLKNISQEILTNKKLTKDMIKTLISNADRIATSELLQSQLKDISVKINKEFLDLMKEGGKTFLSNATTGAKGAYKEFMEKAFKNSLKGYKDALTGVLGNSFSEYIDNLVANKADDMFKTMVKEYIDKGVISDSDELLDGMYKGTFPLDEYSIPVIFTLEEEEVFGEVNFSAENDGRTAIVKVYFSGSIDTEGVLSLKVDSGMLQAKDMEGTNMTCTITGESEGNMKDLKMTFDGNIYDCSGSLMGEEVTPSTFGNSPTPSISIPFQKIEEGE